MDLFQPQIRRHLHLEAVSMPAHQQGTPCSRSLQTQVKYNVLDRGPEKSGLAQQCKDLNVALVAHSPLEQGLLTGAASAVASTHAWHVIPYIASNIGNFFHNHECVDMGSLCACACTSRRTTAIHRHGLWSMVLKAWRLQMHRLCCICCL